MKRKIICTLRYAQKLIRLFIIMLFKRSVRFNNTQITMAVIKYICVCIIFVLMAYDNEVAHAVKEMNVTYNTRHHK